ncbi:MAG: DMT family transporter [Sandaracinaceae bacterium]|nr:DMT family transporter [Sandaracinaceae bacterium]
MANLSFVFLMVFAGVCVAFQSPINSALAKASGSFQASFISFAGGALLSLVMVFVAGNGSLRGVLHAPWWQWSGGAFGIIFIVSVILSVPRIGVSTMMVAGLAGQLAAALAIDQFGWFGTTPRPIDWQRVVAILLFVIALALLWQPARPSTL